MENDRFYHSGLQFECTRCSSCCRHDPGYVFMTQKDVELMAKTLNITVEAFKKEYCRVVDFGFIKRLSLKEKSNYDCIFWGESGCAVYQGRPLQCRAFPFWPRNLMSREDWDDAAKDCPGMNRGKLHDLDVIKAWLDSYHENDLLEG